MGQMGGAAPAIDETGPFAAGKKVFNSHGCARCHTVTAAAATGGMPPGKEGPPMAGPAGKGWGGGPSLAQVGKDPEHTIDWIMAHIRDPKAHKPQSRMPAFNDQRLNDADLRALAEFLASLK
jgi:mono/diheme cytochrome c family protein